MAIAVDDKYTAELAVIAARILDIDPTILTAEKFIKTYRDYQSHHRQHLGPITTDRVLKWKWNCKQMERFGFEN